MLGWLLFDEDGSGARGGEAVLVGGDVVDGVGRRVCSQTFRICG